MDQMKLLIRHFYATITHIYNFIHVKDNLLLIWNLSFWKFLFLIYLKSIWEQVI